MKKHVSLYLKHFGMDGFDEPPFMPCEWCNGSGCDFHHIEARGLGGSKTKDYIENIMCLCRPCHLDCEAKKISIEEQKEIHLNYLHVQSKTKEL